MEEVRAKTRADIIIKLGTAINDSYAMNITEPLVCELVFILDPTNGIFEKEHYKRYHKPSGGSE